MCDVVAGLHLDGLLQQRIADHDDGLVHSALERTRTRAGGNVTQALPDHGLCQDGGGRGPVAGDLVRLRRHLFQQLSAEVLVRVGELDLLGDRHAVVGYDRGAELLVEDDVAPAGPECDLYGVRKRVGTMLQLVPGVIREAQNLRHVFVIPSRATAPARRTGPGAVAADQ